MFCALSVFVYVCVIYVTMCIFCAWDCVFVACTSLLEHCVRCVCETPSQASGSAVLGLAGPPLRGGTASI